jgi:hypothetical protein
MILQIECPHLRAKTNYSIAKLKELARISHTIEFFRRRERILAATPVQA